MKKVTNLVQGFSLIELFIALAILVIVSAIGIPNLINFSVQMKVDNEISQLYRLLLLTRNSAINSGSTTTLCPLDKGNICDTNWQNTLYVFTDLNDNKQYDPLNDEKIISMKKAIPANDQLQYGKNRIAITYRSTGHLADWGQNGTFKFCPNNHADKSRGIVVATSGRIYKSFKTVKEIEKTRSGKRIFCR